MKTESWRRKVPPFDSQELFTWAKRWPKGFAKATNRIQVSWVGDRVGGDQCGAVHWGCSSAPRAGCHEVLARVPVPQFPPLLHEKLWYMWILRKSQVVIGKKWGVFFSFSCRETVFLQTPMGPEAPLLKHTLKFRVEEGHFSCLRSTANSQSCPRIVIGGLQRVAKTWLLLLSS